ncbi:MAG: SAF domain-containing protein [Myxococcales bacterium]|jgi:Flp pilus assembly protein CpaB
MSLFKWPLALLALLLAAACTRAGAPVTVLAAASDLDEGTPLERELVVEVRVPAALATENAVRPEGLEALIGRPIRIPLRKGDLLLTSLFARARRGSRPSSRRRVGQSA